MMPSIRTVTLNPVIDLIYHVPPFEKGTTFRCRQAERVPAGKGDVERFLTKIVCQKME